MQRHPIHRLIHQPIAPRRQLRRVRAGQTSPAGKDLGRIRRAQQPHRLGHAFAENKAPEIERAPPGLQGESDIAQIEFRLRLQMGGQLFRGQIERLARLRRKDQNLRPRRPARAGSSGASSSTRCAFVPPTPKELTPARRG